MNSTPREAWPLSGEENMKLDLAKLDAQINKLEDIKRIASDPEALALLESVLVKGNAPQAEVPKKIRPRTGKEGSQVAAIAEAALATEGPFSGYTLAEKMQEGGYEFKASKPG